MAKLWQKNYDLDSLIEQFTVGDDYVLDISLIPSDCMASIAHAWMLNSIGILSNEDVEALTIELSSIVKLQKEKKFEIKLKDEDGHTAIENHLVSRLGDAGKKIHTGRSRNDQVIAALRVFTRSFLIEIRRAILELVKSLAAFAQQNEAVPMPGRTHMQIAMPSSVGLWAGAFAEELLDDIRLIENAYDFINTCPLGAGASYGVSLPLNRDMVSRLLGFKKVQNNVIYVNNSRGKYESITLDALEQVLLTLNKLSTDIIMFSMPEFGYFTLPQELCTGSSIMPQKKNPDGLELVRAKAGTVGGYASQVKNIIRSLPSGYNRDFQETKRPLMLGLLSGFECIVVMDLTMNKLIVNKEKLAAAFTPDIFATDAAYDLVKQGKTFRDAYREIGATLDTLKSYDPEKSIMSKTYPGTAGNPGIGNIFAECEKKMSQLIEEDLAIRSRLKALAGFDVEIVNLRKRQMAG
jgi:argininosuccinate lyase